MASRKKKLKEKVPEKKLSESFLEFAWPLLELADTNLGKPEMEVILNIPFTIWNAVILDAEDSNNHFVDMLRKLTAGDPIIEQMLERRRTEFAHDRRLIGTYTLLQENGEWRLRVEHRASRPPPR